jgi:hypothetical protein
VEAMKQTTLFPAEKQPVGTEWTDAVIQLGVDEGYFIREENSGEPDNPFILLTEKARQFKRCSS